MSSKSTAGPSLATFLWLIAFVALGLAAVTTRTNISQVLSFAGVGHALTVLAILIDRSDREAIRSSAGRTTTVVYLSFFLIVELAGTVMMVDSGEWSLAVWFGLGVSFAAVGIAATLLRVPADNVLACQIFFHMVNLAPLLASNPIFLIELGVLGRESGLGLGRASMSLVTMVFSCVALPLLLVSLATSLAYNLGKPKAAQDLPWAVMTAHQAIFSLLVFRWTYNGL